MTTINGNSIVRGCKNDQSLDVNIQDQYTQTVTLYLHVQEAETTLSSAASVDDTTITVTDATGIVTGQVITILEGSYFYQSLVTNVATNTLTLASPLDFDFTTSASVCCGDWNLNKDGSSTSIMAEICPPSNLKFDIYAINVHVTDQTEMDSSKFGGISELTNGILFRVVDGTTKNLALIVNNSGFQEHGFDLQFDDKAPAGYYGLHAFKSYIIKNGVSLRIDGSTNDTIQLWIRDDLTDLNLVSCTVMGHVVEN